MEQITVKARAKINPFLQVLYKRADGYHEIRSVMQTLSLYDTVLIKKINKYPFRLICEPDRVPSDERNLVYRAAKYMITEYNINQGVFIKLTKRIPISAGLGGGSSDCAAALVGFNKLFDLRILPDKLVETAGTFGADVPFCVLGGTVLSEGIGEKCTVLNPHPRVWVVLARLPVLVSTAAVFKNWRQPGLNNGTDNNSVIAEGFVNAIKAGDINGISGKLYNSLLDVTGDMHPEIKRLIDFIKMNGALGASMSGSGPTVFGYFSSKFSALAALNAVKKEFPSIRELFLTSTYNMQRKDGSL